MVSMSGIYRITGSQEGLKLVNCFEVECEGFGDYTLVKHVYEYVHHEGDEFCKETVKCYASVDMDNWIKDMRLLNKDIDIGKIKHIYHGV
jgi:hypothetical protein